MLSNEPTLKPGLYQLPDDPVGPRILIPGFRSATSVRGAFGWFSAGWIARLAPGLAEYLNREDAGPIEFTVAPSLFPAELEVLKSAQSMSPEEASSRVVDLFVNGRFEAPALSRHALKCLAWMVATGVLRLRIAIAKPESNYHPKIWLFDDGEHQVLARGSGNATDRGVSGGVEHLDVDVSWIEHSRSRVMDGIRILTAWQQGGGAGIDRVVDLSEALANEIIETAPDVPPQPADYFAAVVEDGNPPWAIEPWERLRRRTAVGSRRDNFPRLKIPGWLNWETGTYAHQKDAVAAWEGGTEPERGTISMATGAGKTLTALICATRSQDRIGGGAPFVVVVSAPSIPLIEQWKGEVAKFGVTAETPTLTSLPDRSLTNFVRRLDSGGTHVMVVTNNMLCSPSFQSTLELKAPEGATLLIGDEAHRLGASGFIKNKPEFFQRRLALSATPERQYDPDGTEEIFEFFGPPVYQFGLDRAIGFCLTPYDYYVHAGTLDGDELGEFEELTRRLGRALGATSDDVNEDDTVLRLMIARRRIIENAESKVPLLHDVLVRRGPRSLKDTLIYASAKNPQQFDDIASMLTELDVRWAGVTQETTVSRSGLNRTLEAFRGGGYQVLLAKKVLDEGVDIPSIREAFIVASSTVEREWIQRRGRVLRLHPGKSVAVVHDFLALPPAGIVGVGDPTGLRKIVGTELGRAYSFARHAQNAEGVGGVLAALREIRAAFWPENGDYGAVLQQAGDKVVAPTLIGEAPW